MTSIGNFYMIISKFSHKKEPGPIVLFVINKNLEINLYHIVLFLGLFISLRVKSIGEPLFNPQKVA